MPARGVRQSGQQSPLSKPPFINIPQFGLGGLVTKPDPQDLKDNECPDLRNIDFSTGAAGTRFGTTLKLAAPSGETGTPSQLLKAKDSLGNDYALGVFGQHFYLADFVNSQWIQINGQYTPTQSGLFYGSANWNAGLGSDYFYFCNGVDDVYKWWSCLSQLASAAASGDSQLTLKDASGFPTTGTLVVAGQSGTFTLTLTGKGFNVQLNMPNNPANNDTWTLTINGTAITGTFVTGSVTNPGDTKVAATAALTLANLLGGLQNPGNSTTTFEALSSPNQTLVGYLTWTSSGSTITGVTGSSVTSEPIVSFSTSGNSTYVTANNTLFISGTVGQAVAANSSVTMAIADMNGMERGNILVVSAPGASVRLFVAGQQGAESTVFWSKSTNQEDFGSTGDPTTGGSLDVTQGDGPILDLQDYGLFVMVVKKNSFTQFQFTVNTTESSLDWSSTPILYGESVTPIGQYAAISVENTYVFATTTQGMFQLVPAMTGYTSQNVMKAFSDAIITLLNTGNVSFDSARTEMWNRMMFFLCSTVPGVNNLALIFDMNWGVWTIWDNLNAADIKEIDDTLYTLCQDDGGLYYYDPSSNQDFRSGQVVGYTTYAYSKRYDFGEAASVKQQSKLMVQGYITQNTKLNVTVLFNENGSLAAATYVIDGSNTDYVQQIPVYGIGGAPIGLNPLGGAQTGTIGVFRVFLDLIWGVGAHNIQIQPQSQNAGDKWAITRTAHNPDLNEKIPDPLVIGIS